MKKRIIIVNNNMLTGGVQKSLVNLLDEINDIYDVTLFLFSKTGNYLEDIPNNVRVIEGSLPLQVLGLPYGLLKDKGILYILLKAFFVGFTRIFNNRLPIKCSFMLERNIQNYDVAISYMHPANSKIFYGGTNEFVLDKINANTKITFVHCDYSQYNIKDIKYISNSLYSKYDYIAFCSEGCMTAYSNMCKEYIHKSYVIHNIHNIKKIKLDSSINPVDHDTGFLNVVLVSRLEYEKGIDIAIKSTARYINKYSDKIYLHIIGSGKNEKDFTALTKNLGISKNVVFYGEQNNPYRIMKNCNMMLHTSLHEAAPMIFGEAEILNVPILSTKTTSTKELILDRNAGVVCDFDIEDISNTIMRFSNDGIVINKETSDLILLSNTHSLKDFDKLVRRKLK